MELVVEFIPPSFRGLCSHWSCRVSRSASAGSDRNSVHADENRGNCGGLFEGLGSVGFDRRLEIVEDSSSSCSLVATSSLPHAQHVVLTTVQDLTSSMHEKAICQFHSQVPRNRTVRGSEEFANPIHPYVPPPRGMTARIGEIAGEVRGFVRWMA